MQIEKTHINIQKCGLSRIIRHHVDYLINCLSPHSDDTGVHQLLDLGSNAGVLQVLLQSRGVVLGLLENGLHDGIL